MINTLLKGLKPMHPGELLREEVLPAIKMPKSQIADRLGLSRETLYKILAEEQPVTPSTALRFGKLFGNGPELWLALQHRFDLYRAEKEIGNQIAKIETLKVA